MDLTTFVHAQLPAAPARVLEVGCGPGELARTIAGLGYAVTAIDPEAPDGDIFQAVSLEDFADPGPFDAVVASRSLHHIENLPGALDKIARLISPGGIVLVYEHAWERFDEPTARWYLGRPTPAGADAPGAVERCLTEWHDHHAGLHGYATIRKELDRRFSERFFAWAPYLYGELGEGVAEEEHALIEAGEIQATGFYYVGEAPRSA